MTLHVFSDFTCPFCRQLAPNIDRIVEEYPDDVRVVFRFFPLANREGARSAAEAAACAHGQGVFDRYHDELFGSQDVVSRPGFDFTGVSVDGLDGSALSECIAASESYAIVQNDVELAFRIGVRSTPTTFINGRPMLGARGYDILRAFVAEELAAAADAAR